MQNSHFPNKTIDVHLYILTVEEIYVYIIVFNYGATLAHSPCSEAVRWQPTISLASATDNQPFKWTQKICSTPHRGHKNQSKNFERAIIWFGEESVHETLELPHQNA